MTQINLLGWKAQALWASCWTTGSAGAFVAVLLIAAGLSGCSTMPDTSKAYPPASLTADCEVPIKRVATNGELALTINAFERALALCNNDKAALRAWSAE